MDYRISNSFVYIILSLLILITFLSTAFNSFFWMDDFWIRDEILKEGLFNVQWYTYWLWDGRAISPLYTDRLFMLRVFDYQSAWLATLISMSFLIGTAYCLLRIFTIETWERINNQQRLIFSLVILFVLVLIFRPHLSRTIYWATGSLYSHANFFSIYLVYRLLKGPHSRLNFLWIFIAISSGPNNGVMLLSFLFLGRFFNILIIKSKIFWLYFSFGLFTLVLIIIAPGNFVRANGQLDFSIYSIISGGIAIIREYSGMSLWLLPGSILIALIFHPFISKTSINLPVLFGICAFCSILPFLPMPNAASKHTVIFFQTFLLIAGIQFWAITLNYFGYRPNSIFINSILLVFLFFFEYQIFNQFLIGRDIKKQMDQRFKVLESNRGLQKKLILDPIQLSDDNWTNRFSDIDPNFDSNIYLEKYFEIQEVKISDSK